MTRMMMMNVIIANIMIFYLSMGDLNGFGAPQIFVWNQNDIQINSPADSGSQMQRRGSP